MSLETYFIIKFDQMSDLISQITNIDNWCYANLHGNWDRQSYSVHSLNSEITKFSFDEIDDKVLFDLTWK